MATIIVNTTLDENDGSITDGDVSLRDAIAAADNGDTITFASGAGDAFESGGTIRLSRVLGELRIASDVTIDGDLDDDGAPDVTITGDTLGDDTTTTDPLGNTITDAINNRNSVDNVGVFNVTGGSSTIDGLVITGGYEFGYVGGQPVGAGVSIASGVEFVLTNCSVSGNFNSAGGGIFNNGTVSLTNTTVADNAWRGIENSGTATLTNTTVLGNNGDGVWNGGTATLTDTTLAGNGSGISNSEDLTLTNTTVSGNRSIGLVNFGTTYLTNTTVSGNGGGGLYNSNSGVLRLSNSIVLGNNRYDIDDSRSDTITEVGPNIIGGQALEQVFASVGPDPNTGVESGLLDNNGGAVPTIALNPHPSNPALDAGQDDRLDESVVGIDLNGDGDTDDVIDTDARSSGFDRLVDLPNLANNGANTADLGALEAESLDVGNTAPAIISPATISVPEIQNSVLDIETTDDFDVEGAGLSYSKSGGADAALFNLDAASGVLTFVNDPDFETPSDANGDNDYEVQVTVTDSNGLSDIQDMIISVIDVIIEQPQTFEVTSADDERDDLDGLGTVALENFGGADDLSLREALALAEQFPFRPDTITFASDPGEAFENGGSIRLSQDLGELVIASDVTIDGDLDDDGAPDVTVTGDALGDDPTTTDPLGNTISSRGDDWLYSHQLLADNVHVFTAAGGASIIDGLVITGGGGDRGIHVAGNAALSITNSSVSGNFGGGISNEGLLTLNHTVVSGNFNYSYPESDRDGGGIANREGASAILTDTTVSGNDAKYGSGGGIYNAGTATLTDSTVSDNYSQSGGGGLNNRDPGTVTLTNTTLSGNRGRYGSGGISNKGDLTLAYTTVSDNQASSGRGGGINNWETGTATLTNTTLAGNWASYGGGGINNSGAATLTNTTVSDNGGGGIRNGGTASLTNVTVAGNFVTTGRSFIPDGGGGINNNGNVTLTNVTVTGNKGGSEWYPGEYSGSGGGILNKGTATLSNTIVLGNNAPEDTEISGTIDENGPNLIGGSAADVFAETVAIDSEEGDEFEAGFLANNGGAVETVALLNRNSNPALDAGQDDRLDESVAGIDLNGDGDTDDVIDTDARGSGFDRFADQPDVASNGANTVDLGAYELQVAAPFEVTTELDEAFDGGTLAEELADGDGLSLREALALANQAPDKQETIDFASGSGEAFENGGTIRLSQALGELVIDSDVTIDGDLDDDGAPDVTITGDTLGDDVTTTDLLGNTITYTNGNFSNTSDNVPVFNAAGGASRIDGLVITGGGGPFLSGYGGGVHVAENAAISISNSSVSGNFAFNSDGAGIFNKGMATLTNTAVSGNVADTGRGGGILNVGTLRLTNTEISGNSSIGYDGGGGISNGGTATLTDTSVSGNFALGGGGGIANDGTLMLTNTTVSSNTAFTAGGGIFIDNGTATLTNTTVSGNHAQYGAGGGILNNGTASLANTIVLGNGAPEGDPEISGMIIEDGPNIIGGKAADVFAETVAIDPFFYDEFEAGVLADNGGAVETIALKNDPSNPALDAGQDDRLDESVVGIDLNGDGDTDDVIDTDARGDGFGRFADQPDVANNGANTVDLGAFELPAEEPGGPDPDLIPVTVTFKGEDAWYSSSFGIYDRSTMKAQLLAADIGETAEGAVLYEAELTQEQLDNLGFFLLPDGARWNADLASLVGEDLMVVETAAGYAVSFDGVPLSGRGAPAFFSDASLDPEGIDHFVEDGTPAAYCLSVEDLAGGGDKDFDDALFLVETGVPRTGAQFTATFEGESAFFHNTFGYFIEDTGEAEIIFAHMDETTLPPGTTETFDLTAEEYGELEFFLIPDGGRKNADLFTDLDALDLIVEEVNGALQARDQVTGTVLEGFVNPVYVPEKAGNPDATRHALQMGDVDDFELRWEDLPDGGDADYDEPDYDDTIIGIQISPDDVLV